MNILMLIRQVLSSLPMIAISEQAFSTAAAGGPYNSIPKGDTGTIINFYLNWASYLHLGYGFMHAITGYFMGGVVRALFTVDHGLEVIYNSIFRLLGWEGNVATGGPMHIFWVFFQGAGWSLFALGIVIVAFQSMHHRTEWSQIGPNIIMVGVVMAVFPMMMTMFNQIAQSAETDINNIHNSQTVADVAVQPIKNNVIDLSTLIRHDFGNFKYKPDSSKIRNVANWNVLSTPKSVKEMDLGQYLDKDTMSKNLKLDKHKAGEEAMKYHLEDEHSQVGGGYIIAKNKAGAGAGSLNDQVYSRYSVNWIGLIGQSLVLGFVLIVAGIRLTKDIFELSLMNLFAPLVAYRSIRSTKKLRDLISSVAGMYTSVVFMMVLIKIYLLMIQTAQAKVPSMNWFQRSILVLIIYIGCSFALFSGVTYLERLTGVSQGIADETGQLIAAGAVGGAVSGLAGGLLGHTMSFAGGTMSKIGNHSRSNTHGKSNNSSNNLSNSLGGNSKESTNNQSSTSGLSQENGNSKFNNEVTGDNGGIHQNSTNNPSTDSGSGGDGKDGANGSATQGSNGLNGNNTNSGNQNGSTPGDNQGIDTNASGIEDVNGQVLEAQADAANNNPQGGIDDPDGVNQPNGINEQGYDFNSSDQPSTTPDSAMSDNVDSNYGNGIINPDGNNMNSSNDFDQQEAAGIPGSGKDSLDNFGINSDPSFQGQADQINDQSFEDKKLGQDPYHDENHLEANRHVERHAQTPHQPSGLTRAGEKLQHAGRKTTNVSRSVRQRSTNYLKSHQFNLSQNGNLHGRESEHLE